MAVNAMLSKGITLAIDGEVIEGMQSTPELSEATEKIETTDLSSANKTYTNGLKDFGDALSFGFVYDKAQFMKVRALQDGEKHEAVITYPDGLKVEFEAMVAVILSGAEVNAILTYTVELTPASDIEITAGE
jgi:predicted amidohydrolase YtcJ